MKTLKINTDFDGALEALNDAEVGRLFLAMLRYASSGSAPDLRGNERFVWGVAKGIVDGQRASFDKQQAGNIRRHEGASQGIMPHDDGSCPVEKASPLSPPTPPVNTPLKERKKTIPKGIAKERPLDAALTEFKAMRNRMRKPMTPLAVELLVKKLEKMAPGDENTQVAILMQSIENGWTGVYELKERNDWKRNTLLNYQESGKSHPNLGDIEMDLEEL